MQSTNVLEYRYIGTGIQAQVYRYIDRWDLGLGREKTSRWRTGKERKKPAEEKRTSLTTKAWAMIPVSGIRKSDCYKFIIPLLSMIEPHKGKWKTENAHRVMAFLLSATR